MAADHRPLSPTELRLPCEPEQLPFESTEELEPLHGVIGQEDAVESLRFGLEVHAPGQNVYVRGLVGTGRQALVKQLLQDIQPACPLSDDLCYVHDFEEPDRPRLIRIPRGKGASFREAVEELASYIETSFGDALGEDTLRGRRKELEDGLREQLEALGAPFDKELREAGLGMLQSQGPGGEVQPVILPVIEEQPAPPERLQQLLEEGGLTEQDLEQLGSKVQEFGGRFEQLSEQMQRLREEHRRALRRLVEDQARGLLHFNVQSIESRFPAPGVGRFLYQVVEDVVRRRMSGQEQQSQVERRYRVNLLLAHRDGDGCPIVTENMPTVPNLLGTIEREVGPGGAVVSDHTMITAGSILRANGGYLVLEARDLLAEPGAWKLLMRTLRTRKLEVVPHDSSIYGRVGGLKPEPIDVDLKVILIGDPGLYYMLDGSDPDFPHQFKVLADFESTVPRDEEGAQYYGRILARLSSEEQLPPFGRCAVAAMVEHGARISGRRDRLTVRVGRLSDIAREAAFVGRRQGAEQVLAAHVSEAIARGRRRADMPARRFRKEVERGTLGIETRGKVVGQINGLAVVSSGPLSYGFPSRITATIGPGSAGMINIEREAQLSGAIHTKGFYILGGLLRHLLPTSHPLAFSASIAFEQSYGGIDGDSASGAEMCCLLSALTGVPIDQGFSMTGAIDQHGSLQAIGAATEKVEGFFDTCLLLGLTGTQGAIIPRANAGDLMLRPDIVEACREGRFHVHAVDHLTDALEILTGQEAGEPDGEGRYPEGTILALAVERATEYWGMVSGRTLPAQQDAGA